MKLYRLAYYSKVAKGLTKADLRDIMAKSVLNNQRDGLTGALAFTTGLFLQVLEGQRSNINATVRRIIPDPRHLDFSIIGMQPADDRVFGNWAMAFIDESKTTKALLLKHGAADKLVPEYFSLDGAVAFMKDAVA